MELLEFARGPGLAISVTVFVLGLAWRLYRIFRRPVRAVAFSPDGSEVFTGNGNTTCYRIAFAKLLEE